MKIEPQAISENDLAVILNLHQRRLGWSYLLENTISDRIVGFPCESEEFLARRELKTAFFKVSEWFKLMGRKENWPSIKGWMWEIDFQESQAVPKRQAQGKDNEANLAENESLIEGPIMTLGDLELDVIKRLLEKREALADFARSRLRLFCEDNYSKDELYKHIQELGAAEKDVRDWFAEMAEKYKWPRANGEKWVYRVDIGEKKVFLSSKGESL